MLDVWRRTHITAFPKRVFIFRVLQNGIDPVWYDGNYEKIVEKVGDGGTLETRTLWIRRKLPTNMLKRGGGLLLGAIVGSFVGWIIGTILALVLGLSAITYLGMGIFALAGIFLMWITTTNVELFEYPAPEQSAYQDGVGDNTGKDVIWLLQIGLNQFYPVVYKDKAFYAKITDKVPIYKWEPVLDQEGKQVIGSDGKPAYTRGEFVRFEEKTHMAQVFNANYYLDGDEMNPVVRDIPYVVAHKASDTYQWLLMQAERANQFYRKGGFWDRYGNIVVMAICILAMLIIMIVGLQKFAELQTQATSAFTTGMDKFTSSVTANFDKFTSQVADAVRSSSGQGAVIKPPS